MRARPCTMLLLTCCARVAMAEPTTDECVDANTAGQSLRLHHRLLEARKPFETCASVSCPRIVRADCEKRLTELDHATPTVLLAAKDPTGDLPSVSVTLDGTPLATSARGEAVAVDPGEHRFVFASPGHEPLTRDVVVNEGDKVRVVSAEWDLPPQRTVEVASASQAPPFPLRPAGLITGAVGVLGLALGTFFGIGSYIAWGNVKNECFQAPACDLPSATADRNTAIAFATASDVAFVAGGVLLATGVVLFALAPKSPVAPAVGTGTFGVVLRGWF